MTGILRAWVAGSLVLMGCAPAVEPLRPASNAPVLIGEWNGQWGGTGQHGPYSHPMRLVIGQQVGTEVAGNVTYFPEHRPPATDTMTGTIGARQDGSVWVYITAAGGTDFRLKVVSDRRLEGEGISHVHIGPVVLTRE